MLLSSAGDGCGECCVASIMDRSIDFFTKITNIKRSWFRWRSGIEAVCKKLFRAVLGLVEARAR